jgi:hypothetical protein
MILAQDRDIQSLVADIDDSKLLLPEMQRRYVWKAAQVRDLFDSLYHEYPSGQLLVWETDELPTSGIRKVSVGGLSAEQRRPQLLLDGQQRLTSLAAVMLGRPLLVRDVARHIDIVFNVYTEKFEVSGPRQRGQTGWISLVKFFKQGAMAIYRELKLDPGSPGTDDVFDRLNRLDNIKRYRYRVNVLEHLSYGEVTHIFVRTNSGGTTLGYADLALAQVSSSWQGVTKAFEDFQHDLKAKSHGMHLDNGLLLRSIVVLLTGQSRFIRFFRGDRQQVTVADLEAAWERAKKALDQAISFLVHNCLIDRLEMLPTRSVLIPLVAYFDRYGTEMSNIQARELQRWVYMALIWTRYSASSETAMDQDIAALSKEQPIQSMIQNIENEVGSQRPITENELRDQRKNSPYMLMTYVLARRARAQDWFNGVVIGNDHSSDLVLHHIFPKSFLSEQYKLREDSRTVDQVANLAFLSAPIGKAAANRPPVEYLPKIDEQRLRSQYVPLQRDLWRVDQFDAFMLQRRKMLADAINQFLQSLTEDNRLWVHSPVEIMEMRVDGLERQLRTLVEDRLSESRGDIAWNNLIPSEIQNAVKHRIAQRLASKPFETGQYETLASKLSFCQFSDYSKIIKANWPLFDDIFGKETTYDKYSGLTIEARNALKHGQELTHVDLASAEAGFVWLEECLSNIKVEEEIEEDELVAETV